jgi:hypothetical protein
MQDVPEEQLGVNTQPAPVHAAAVLAGAADVPAPVQH